MARRGENIRKRKDSRWEGRYIKARTSEGKIQWGYVYGTVYAEVKRVLIQKKAEAGFYNLKRTDLTFEALAEVWLHSLRSSIKESTYAHYSYTLHKYLLPVLSKVPVTSLDESFLEQAMKQIIAPIDAAHKPLGNSSARECLSMLRRICKYATHLRLIRPMELEVALPKAIDKISTPLSPTEQQRLYQYVQENPTPRKIGLMLGLELGLRIGEICGLQWGDFDLKLGTLKISRTVCRISCGNGHTKVVIQAPKTRTSRREIPIPKQLLMMLKKLRENTSNATWFLYTERKNIVIAHKNRGGVSSARNYGVRCAKGNYICFVDADDLISEKFVESLYKGIKENQTLMSACRLEKVRSLSQKREPEEQITFKNFCGADIWQNVNTGYCVTKMYDKSIFLNSEFDETISMCEDALFVSTVLNKIQSCCATKSILYYYRENPQGASHLANAQKYKQAIEVSKKIMLFDLIGQTEENLRIYKDFQAVWELKYMLALSAENKSKDNDQIRSEQKLYRKELLPYTKNTMDKRVKLANFIIMLPYPIFQLSLSAINNVLRKR